VGDEGRGGGGGWEGRIRRRMRRRMESMVVVVVVVVVVIVHARQLLRHCVGYDWGYLWVEFIFWGHSWQCVVDATKQRVVADYIARWRGRGARCQGRGGLGVQSGGAIAIVLFDVVSREGGWYSGHSNLSLSWRR